MKINRQKRLEPIILIWIFFLFVLGFPSPAYAYLDPGSGSYLVQIVIASLLGSGILIKTSWAKIKNTLAKFFKKTARGDEEKD